MKLTKIIATLGPASHSKEMIEKLIVSGADVFRLNFSHGTHEMHQEIYQSVREISAKRNQFTAVLQDLSGPKIRIGKIEGEGLVLTENAPLIFTQNKEDQGKNSKVYLAYAPLFADVKEGERLLLADGQFEVEVTGTSLNEITTKVLRGGKLTSNKGLNLPNTKLRQSALTAKDVEDVRYGLRMGVDYVALSFVRNAQDIIELRAIMKAEGRVVPIIAKIEKPEALEDIENILQVSDGIMIARGDLAIETSMEKVPYLQKELIHKARLHGKPVIVATQMLESMISSKLPTRAEVTDVSAAVLDGADAVMLSAETATGAHPEIVVQQMARILYEAEHHNGELSKHIDFQLSVCDLEHAIASAVASMSQTLKAKIILAPTTTGRTPELISRLRLSIPVFTLSPHEETLRKVTLYYGVKPLGLSAPAEHFSELLEMCKNEALKTDYLKKNDYMIVTIGHPITTASGHTNLIKAIKI